MNANKNDVPKPIAPASPINILFFANYIVFDLAHLRPNASPN